MPSSFHLICLKAHRFVFFKVIARVVGCLVWNTCVFGHFNDKRINKNNKQRNKYIEMLITPALGNPDDVDQGLVEGLNRG